jgi:SOS-response transcriptional repressor LexA
MTDAQATAQQTGRGKLGEMLKRIDQRLREVNMSDRAASLAAGLSAAQLRTMRRQYFHGTQHGVSVRTITGLARALRTTPEWLMSGTGPQETANGIAQTESASGLPLAGVVAAGVWNEIGVEGERLALAPVPPDPRYPAESQSAYEARGASTNRLARPGDFLIVIDREQMGLPLRSGDLVIVTQSKQGLREVTARRYRLVNGRHLFAFESTDSRYDMGVEIPDIKGSDFFQIGGVVVAVYRPLM